PVALPDSAVTAQDAGVSVPVLANDSDPDGTLVVATLRVTAPPAHGVALADTVAGAVVYTPAAAFAGRDTLLYTVADNEGAVSEPARVVITVLDTAPPGAVAAFTAAPGAGCVDLAWSGVPADADSLELWRALWRDGTGLSAYPRYDDAPGSAPPVRPADRAAALADTLWARVAALPAAAVAFTDSLPVRGVYHYEIFARDAAGNWGPRADAGPRATSYRLGDLALPFDGVVDAADLGLLDAGYGKALGDSAFAPAADIGPTDDGSGAGVPLTDGRLDFEDVMIAAVNFAPPAAGPTPGGQVLLGWRRVDETVWALRLDAANPSLKGLRLTADLPPGITAAVAPGPLLALQAAPAFLRNDLPGHLDVALALLGAGAGFDGTGELLRVTLSGYVPLAPPAVVARAVDNSALPSLIQTVTDVPVAPAFALAQNCPNPFNPATTIRFALPAAGPVRLVVFDPRGRRVAALVEGELAAGDHAVLWRGLDDRGAAVASGTYLYRLEAGGRVETRRLTLVR
ncbi:MAG: Ig-like domain-containing protein, partial [Candidatus Krumholzibacteriia bacterium]